MYGASIRRTYRILAVLGALVALGFVLAILAIGGPGDLLHEVAGTILLVLLLGATMFGVLGRSESPLLLGRALLGLVVLIAVGAVGASLSIHALPSSLDTLPLVLLGGLIVAESEMIRVSGIAS